MKRLLFITCVIWANSSVGAPVAAPDDWDLVRAYNTSTHVFYGEVLKTIPERNFKTGVQGVHPQDIDGNELPLQEIVWPLAKELSFAVEESFIKFCGCRTSKFGAVCSMT